MPGTLLVAEQLSILVESKRITALHLAARDLTEKSGLSSWVPSCHLDVSVDVSPLQITTWYGGGALREGPVCMPAFTIPAAFCSSSLRRKEPAGPSL